MALRSLPKMSGALRAGALRYTGGAERPTRQIAGREAGGVWAIVLAILFWLIFYGNLPWSLNGMNQTGPAVQDAADASARLIKLAMLVLSTYVIASRWSVARAVIKYFNPGMVALLVLCLLSAAWSFLPAATILRFVSLFTIVLVCFAISVCGWHRQRLAQLSIPPLVFILVGSLVVGVILPDRIAEIGTDVSQRNAWHGITHGKNEFGMFAAMGVIIFANRWMAREGRVIWSIAGVATSFLCLILSRSNTSLLSTLIGVGSMVLVMQVPIVRQRFSTHVVVGITVTILVYELAMQNVVPGVNTLLAPILKLTGKDMTFSARTIIWNVVKQHIQGAPYLGTGYGAYWLGPFINSPSYIFVPLMYFYPMEAHNGYLDIVNDLGLLGLMCFLFFVFWFLRQALQLMQYDRSQAALYLALLFQELVINMSESDFFSRTSTFAILMLAITSLSRGLMNARLSQPPVRSR